MEDARGFEFPLTDLALVVEGKRLYVNKEVMKHHSPVFKTMLEGNYIEKDAAEIELLGKSFDDVKVFIRSFYPNMEHPINETNVLQIYPLAHEYQMSLVSKCEDILMHLVSNYNKSYKSPNLFIKHLCLAERYHIDRVVTSGIEAAAHIEQSALHAGDNIAEYQLLSESTRLKIAERRVELLEKREHNRNCSKPQDYQKMIGYVRRWSAKTVH